MGCFDCGAEDIEVWGVGLAFELGLGLGLHDDTLE